MLMEQPILPMYPEECFEGRGSRDHGSYDGYRRHYPVRQLSVNERRHENCGCGQCDHEVTPLDASNVVNIDRCIDQEEYEIDKHHIACRRKTRDNDHASAAV